MEKEKAPSNPVGRPTVYKSEYCEMLIEHMRNGASFDTFGVTIGVSKDTLYDWVERHQEFLDAKKVAFDESKKCWENIMYQQATGKINGSSTALIFALKNRFPKDYRDRTEQKVQAYVGDIENDPERLSQEQLEEIAKVMRSKN